MKTRRLGKTGLDVSMIGLGTEYLNKRSRETVVSVIHEAIDSGVNYFDLVFTFSEYLDNLAAAFKGQRDKLMIAGHLGSGEENGNYRKTRDVKECEGLFFKMLSRLHTDYIDVLFLQFVDEEDDYKKVMGPGGLLELALRFQQEEKARFIALSSHNVPIALKAVESGQIDVLMFSINLASDTVSEEKELFNACASRDLGLVAMKSFAGGKLLQKGDSKPVTPVQCISYALSQIGVSTVVPGVKNVGELKAALYFLDATSEEKDFSSAISEFRQGLKGECVYCNHCLPCPVSIDIGRTMRMVDAARNGVSDELRVGYDDLPAKASDCIDCGVCMERCPFEVDVISGMKQAVELFETES